MKVPGRRHGARTDIQARMDMGHRPVEDAREFVPIGDLLEGQQFDRRAGDDEAVKLAVCDLVPGIVETD